MDRERRREQNRAAQRRFRQRQRSAAVIAKQAQGLIETNPSPTLCSSLGPTPQLKHKPDNDCGRRLISPENTESSVPLARLSRPPVNHLPVDTPRGCSIFRVSGANVLLDNIELLDMNKDGMPDKVPLDNKNLQKHKFTDMLGELANAEKTSFESIHICHRVLHPKGKEPENDPGILQRHHVNDSDASISGPDESATKSETAGWLTPLHVAAQKGRGKLLDILLQHDADCNAKDSDSLTPLAHP